MSLPIVLPKLDPLAKLLSSLIGRKVQVAKAAKPFVWKGPVLVATFIDDEDKLCALAVGDVPFGAHSGAALSMVPPGVATESVRKNVLPPDLLDNAREVLNVATSLFNTPGARHLRLQEVKVELQPQKEIVGSPQRLDVSVDITGYGQGQLTFAPKAA
ncbi:MAG: hypothetical protein U0271_37815 [Polyangiaceae bacterium]